MSFARPSEVAVIDPWQLALHTHSLPKHRISMGTQGEPGSSGSGFPLSVLAFGTPSPAASLTAKPHRPCPWGPRSSLLRKERQRCGGSGGMFRQVLQGWALQAEPLTRDTLCPGHTRARFQCQNLWSRSALSCRASFRL